MEKIVRKNNVKIHFAFMIMKHSTKQSVHFAQTMVNALTVNVLINIFYYFKTLLFFNTNKVLVLKDTFHLKASNGC